MIWRGYLAVGLLLACGLTHSASIVISNQDGAGEGFNDTTPTAAVGGNTGTTLGQQRLNVFTTAADIWGSVLNSSVTITVAARFDPLFCSSNSATLGSAGATGSAHNGVTAFHIALAESLNNSNLNGTSAEISATFNSDVDDDPVCLGGGGWYYGLDDAPPGQRALFPVVLHELGHGLGFSSLTNLGPGGSGNFIGAGGFPDAYSRNLRDVETSEDWDVMTSGERLTSATNDPDVVWTGTRVTADRDLWLGAAPEVEINAPAGIAGTFLAVLGQESPALTGMTTAAVVDGNALPADGCSAVNAGGAWTGRIVLFDSPPCGNASIAPVIAEFEDAVGVIIVATTATGFPDMSGGIANPVVIPYVGVEKSVGDSLRANLGTANVSIQASATILNGENGGQVRMYAPNPFEGGSSISHFTTAATPDLLMEPSLGSQPFDQVDLTVPAFEDMGWPLLSSNESPVAMDDGPGGSFVVTEEMGVTLTAAQLKANDTDAEDTTPTGSVSIVGVTSNGSVMDNGNQSFTFTHDGTETSSASFQYQVQDSEGVTSNTATVSLTVSNTNDNPVANDDTGPAVNEGESVMFAASTIKANDTDEEDGVPPGGGIVIAGVSVNGTASFNMGTMTFTHDGTETTTASFQYQVMDSQGALSNTATVSLTVNNTNDNPVANDDSGFEVTEGTSVMFAASLIKANDTDEEDGTPPGGGIVITGTSVNGTASFNMGTITFTHDGTETNTASFQYQVMDSQGALSNTATVSLTVNNTNDNPVANDDSGFEVTEETSVMFAASLIKANDTDEEDGVPPGGGIVITGTSVNGTASFSMGTITFTHDGTETTTASFQYQVMDSQGALSNTATVSLSVDNTNDNPVANDDSGFIVTEGASVMFPASQIKANDTDEEDGVPPMGGIVIAGVSVNGTASFNMGTMTFTHDGSATNTASFQYQVMDSQGALSNLATVNLSVVSDTFAQCAPGGRRAIVGVPVSIDVSGAFGLASPTYSATGLPASLDPIDTNTGIITGTPVIGDLTGSPFAITVTANDGLGGIETFDFAVTVENDFDSIFYSSLEDTCVGL